MKSKWKPSLTQLPQTIQNILSRAITELSPQSIILFGSRARNTHRENSDFDIALLGVENNSKWTNFSNQLNEEPWTLYGVDLVLYESLGDDYRTNIQKEGVLLYEQ